MEKLAYHLNKQKTPSNTEGKFLYYYSCVEGEIADTVISGKAYKVIEVTEEEWETLIEFDRLEYNNHHAETRRHFPLIEDFEHIITNGSSDKKPSLEEKSVETVDKDNTFTTFSKEEKAVATMCIDEGYTQKETAKELGLTQGYISSLFNSVKHKFDDGDYETDIDGIIWKSWNQYLEKGYCDNYFDFFVILAIRQLDSIDLYNYVQWFFSIGEMLRYMARYSLFNEKTMADDIKAYLDTADFKDKERFAEAYGNTFIPIQAMVCRMNTEIERRKKIQNGNLYGESYQNLIITLNKIADKKGITSDEYLRNYFLPDFINKVNKRYDSVVKHIQNLMTKPKYSKLFK